MAKPAFNGAPEGPAPAQDYNLSVHDRPSQKPHAADQREMAKTEDIRPLEAIPAEGQSTHDGWSGFIEAEKFSNQGSMPYNRDDLNWETRSGMQPRKK